MSEAGSELAIRPKLALNSCPHVSASHFIRLLHDCCNLYCDQKEWEVLLKRKIEMLVLILEMQLKELSI